MQMNTKDKIIIEVDKWEHQYLIWQGPSGKEGTPIEPIICKTREEMITKILSIVPKFPYPDETENTAKEVSTNEPK